MLIKKNLLIKKLLSITYIVILHAKMFKCFIEVYMIYINYCHTRNNTLLARTFLYLFYMKRSDKYVRIIFLICVCVSIILLNFN